MEQRYKVDTRSSIELKGINIYQDSKSQEWSVVLEKKEDSYIVVIVRSTLYDSDAEKNLKSLLNMVEDVYARIALRVSRNGEMIVDNRTEIINHWETIQENIMATFGCDDEMKTFCKNVREGLDNIDRYVKRNMIFFVLLSTFSRREEFEFLTDSFLSVGDSIKVNIKRNESAEESAGKDILIHEGRAVPVDLRQMRGKYDDKVSQYIGSPFVYDFSFISRYEYDNQKGGMFDNAVCNIYEQMSDGYSFKNHIEFISL